MKWSREDLAWVAGFYEGEGWCGTTSNKDKNTGKVKQKAFKIGIANTTLESLEKVKSIYGFGRIWGPRQIKNNKPLYFYFISNFQEAQAFIASIWHLLSNVRKEQATVSLQEMHEYFSTRQNVVRIGPVVGERILKFKKEGLSYEEIAVRYNLNKKTIASYCHRNK